MRDHPKHDFPILGCAWGTKLLSENVRNNWIKSWKNGLEDDIMWVGRHKWGPDQDFLKK